MAAGAVSPSSSSSSSSSSPDPLDSLVEEFLCPLCGGYFRDPMITSCGHNFCHFCISRAWERCRDSFPCPECGAASPEIRLRPNRQLRNAAEPAEALASRTQVTRWERKRKKRAVERAVMRWFMPVILPSEEEIMFPSPCPEHGEPLDLFCSQHQRPVCVSCRDLPQHRGHDFLPIPTAAQKYQEKSEAHLKTLWEEREKLKTWKAMGKEKSHKYRKQTQAERQKIVAEFQQLRQFLQEQEQLLLAQLQKLEEELEKHKTERGRKLSMQISCLSERIGELEVKCQKPASELLQGIRSILSRCEEARAQQPEMAPELEERVRDFSQQTVALSKSLRAFRATLPAALAAQRGYSQANVTLDPDTAHPNLVLWDDGKSVKWEHAEQLLPDTPERFDSWFCVLGREGFTSGRHCWEVELRNGEHWGVGVAKESMNRRGEFSRSPQGGIWAVWRYNERFLALTDPETPLHLTAPSRIRVCLDCDQGQVTFIDATAEAPIFTFPPGSLPGERIRPWLMVGWAVFPFKLHP